MQESLKKYLDEFSSKWKNKVRVEEDNIEVTDCFYNKKTKKFKAPKSFGDLSKNKVCLYVVFGADFINKYKRNKKGKLLYKNSKFVVKEPDFEFRALACLCTKSMRNVSFHEIYDAISVSKKPDVQGFRRWVLRNIINKIRANYPIFNPDKDTAFIFAGQENEILSKLNLNRIWLKQITNYGSRALNLIDKEETILIEEVFNYNKNSSDLAYRFGNELHIPETAIFLEKKFNLILKVPSQNSHHPKP